MTTIEEARHHVRLLTRIVNLYAPENEKVAGHAAIAELGMLACEHIMTACDHDTLNRDGRCNVCGKSIEPAGRSNR